METQTKNELITEGSALLAEFIGWHKQSRTTFMVPNNYPFDYPSGETEFTIESFEFHKRWDWIMPVIDELALYDIHVNIDTERIFLHIGGDCHSFAKEVYKSKIAATYAAVVAGIKWYNSQRDGGN